MGDVSPGSWHHDNWDLPHTTNPRHVPSLLHIKLSNVTLYDTMTASLWAWVITAPWGHTNGPLLWYFASFFTAPVLETSLCNVQAAETSWGCRLAWPTVLSRLGTLHCPPLARGKPHSERPRVSSSASLLDCPQADGCFTNYFIITSYRHIHYFSVDGSSAENVNVLWKELALSWIIKRGHVIQLSWKFHS